MTPPLLRFRDTACRIVESQEQVATTRIVGNLVDQSRLEDLLEESKPGTVAREQHYLLTTPFRYPPLRHGSRFGSRFEPALFYGSLKTNTCLAECAYYRLLFYLDMVVPPPTPVSTQHTLFQVLVDSRAAVDLRTIPYDRVQDRLTDPSSYEFTQKLGAELRDIGANVLLFRSARDSAGGTNIALYTPAVLAESQPRYQEMWQSQVDATGVIFRGPAGIAHFPAATFCDDRGNFLRVANSTH